jgi:cytoskeletal protein RodZ
MTGFVTKKISKSRARSLCSILKSARTKADLTLEAVEQQTHIPAKHLQALEQGAYHLLPAEAYNIGFVRRYAETLKLDPEKIVAQYREERSKHRFTDCNDTVQLRPRTLGDWNFLITPKLIAVVGMVLLFGGIASYIYLQVRKFAEPPQLVMNVPNEFTSNRDTVTINGRTDEGVIVSMNTEPISVGSAGDFSQEVQLSPGLNQIVVMARNRAQKESRTTVKVLYKQDVAKVDLGTTAPQITP